MVRNTFRTQADRILGGQIDYIDVNKSLGVHTEEHAFLELGHALGASRAETVRAYRRAKAADERVRAAAERHQETLLASSGTKILLAGHGYVLHDPFVGAPASICSSPSA